MMGMSDVVSDHLFKKLKIKNKHDRMKGKETLPPLAFKNQNEIGGVRRDWGTFVSTLCVILATFYLAKSCVKWQMAEMGDIHRDLGTFMNAIPTSFSQHITSPKSCVQINDTEKCSDLEGIHWDRGIHECSPASPETEVHSWHNESRPENCSGTYLLQSMRN